MDSCDVAIIGGGIIGVSAAAFLAEEGLSVRLFERDELGAGASGRNSGAIQHPFDEHMAALHRETLAIYRALADDGSDFQLPPEPTGLLLLSADSAAVGEAAASISRRSPELEPTILSADQLRELEPLLAPDLGACRIATGYPVAPMAATAAFAERARRAGAWIELDAQVEPLVRSGRADGVVTRSGHEVAAGRILVAAGPWSSSIVPGWAARPPIRSVWGVVASVSLPNAPRPVLEELGIDRPGRPPDELFSLVTAGGVTSVGSTFLADEPDAHERARRILERGARFVPALEGASVIAVRRCARPQSLDGRPLVGAVPGIAGLYVCAGHGAWGISTGPASARIVVDEMVGRGTADAVFSPARF
jgi:glycine/D-amino acid oxidase-like deaminating enzyme